MSYQKDNDFVTSCLLSCALIFWKGFNCRKDSFNCPKEEHIPCFRVGPFSQERQNNFDTVPSSEMVSICFNVLFTYTYNTKACNLVLCLKQMEITDKVFPESPSADPGKSTQ